MRKADNLPPYCAVVKKSRSLNFLEPSGTPMACTESALPLLSVSVRILELRVVLYIVY